MTPAEKAVLELIQAMIVHAQGMSGNWGNPPHCEELRRIRDELSTAALHDSPKEKP